MKNVPAAIRATSGDDDIAPVTILDGQGQVVRVVAAAEFRRTHPQIATSGYHPVIRPRRAEVATS